MANQAAASSSQEDRIPQGLQVFAEVRQTTIRWDADPEYQIKFNEWWQTTGWATAPSTKTHKPPNWGSTQRSSTVWEAFDQGAKFGMGQPVLVCRTCRGVLSHPSAQNLGTTQMKNHLTSKTCKKAASSEKPLDRFLVCNGAGLCGNTELICDFSLGFKFSY